MVLGVIAITVLGLVAACGSPEPTPTPTSPPPPTPTATATPTPASSDAGETTDGGAVDGSADAGGFDYASVTDPTDISQLPPETQEMATCMKETLGDERFGKVMIDIFDRYYVPLDVDLALVNACGLTIRQVSNLGVEFGLGRL
jgi:hypothetical protein